MTWERIVADEVAIGLIAGAPSGSDAARIGLEQRVKVRDVLGDWPPGTSTWAADAPGSGALTSAPGGLRLLWFSAPDEDGWFRLTATDPLGASWSAYCRTPAQSIWPPLERALGELLREPLDRVGDGDLEPTIPQAQRVK
jgi:hypothetical protein